MALAIFILAVLAFMGRVEAFSSSEKTAFVGVDSLHVKVYAEPEVEGLVLKRQLRTKAELVLRTSGVPVYEDAALFGSRLEISLLGWERAPGYWACTLHATLSELAVLFYDGKDRFLRFGNRKGQTYLWRLQNKGFLRVSTWEYPLYLGTGPREKVRDGLLNTVGKIAEEVSNLYLSTR